MFRCGIQVGEVATPATGHKNLLAGLVGMVQHQHPMALVGRRGRTHQPGCAGTDNHHIYLGCACPCFI